MWYGFSYWRNAGDSKDQIATVRWTVARDSLKSRNIYFLPKAKNVNESPAGHQGKCGDSKDQIATVRWTVARDGLKSRNIYFLPKAKNVNESPAGHKIIPRKQPVSGGVYDLRSFICRNQCYLAFARASPAVLPRSSKPSAL